MKLGWKFKIESQIDPIKLKLKGIVNKLAKIEIKWIEKATT